MIGIYFLYNIREIKPLMLILFKLDAGISLLWLYVFIFLSNYLVSVLLACVLYIDLINVYGVFDTFTICT